MSELIDIDKEIKDYLHKEHHLPVEDIDNHTLLFSDGYLDSFNMVALVEWIEKKFQIKFGVLDVNLHSLDSIERMKEFIISRINK